METRTTFRTVFFFVTALIALCVVFTIPIGVTHVEAKSSDYLAPYSPYDVVKITNKARHAKGLDRLTLNASLSLAAQNKANDMARNAYFGHVSPSGLSYANFITTSGYTYMYSGENLAFQYTNASALMKAWLKSSGHRANILSEHYTDIGVGIAYGERGGKKGWYVVGLYGARPQSAARSTL